MTNQNPISMPKSPRKIHLILIHAPKHVEKRYKEICRLFGIGIISVQHYRKLTKKNLVDHIHIVHIIKHRHESITISSIIKTVAQIKGIKINKQDRRNIYTLEKLFGKNIDGKKTRYSFFIPQEKTTE